MQCGCICSYSTQIKTFDEKGVLKMKEYLISYKALKTTGDIVGTLVLKIELPDIAFTKQKEQVLHRLCVEYARLQNVACSFVRITNIIEVI